MSIELIKSMFTYDTETGQIFWSDFQTSAFRGKPAGTIDAHGYIVLTLKRKKFKAHRIAWLLVYGKWPNGEIDHIDGNKLNNKIENLREASSQLNKWNHVKAQENSGTGFRGVCKHRDKFMADIKVNGKKVYLGLFDTPEMAHQAYIEAKKIYHPGWVQTHSKIS